MTTNTDRWLLRAALLLMAFGITALLFISCIESPAAPTPLMILNPDLQGIK